MVKEGSLIGKLSLQLKDKISSRGITNSNTKVKKKNMDRKMSKHIIMKLTIKTISKVI